MLEKGNMIYNRRGGFISPDPEVLKGNNRRRVHILYRKEILGTNCTWRDLLRSNIPRLLKTQYKAAKLSIAYLTSVH